MSVITYQPLTSEEISTLLDLNAEKISSLTAIVTSRAYLQLDVPEALLTKLSSAFGIPLTSPVPAQLIKKDISFHKDVGPADFQYTYLYYLTDSEGSLVIDGTSYPIAKGTAYRFAEGLEHGTVGTGESVRLSIGPFNEFEQPVGASGGFYYYIFTAASTQTVVVSTIDYYNTGDAYTIQTSYAALTQTGTGDASYTPPGKVFVGWDTSNTYPNTPVEYTSGQTGTFPDGYPTINLYPVFQTPASAPSTTTSAPVIQTPVDSSRLTEIRQDKMIYANYISKVQANNQGCDTARTGLDNGLPAPGSITNELADGALNTTGTERDRILASTACPTPAVPTTYTVTQDGLVLYYNPGDRASFTSGDLFVYDLSTSKNTGTLQDGTTFSSTNGGTFVFDGTNNNYITTTNAVASQIFTTCAWIKSSDFASYHMVVSNETVSGGGGWNYRMYLNSGDGILVGDIALPGGGSDLVNYNVNIADGNWHFICFSRDPILQLKLYLDGNLVNTTTGSVTGTITNSQPVWIGLSAYGGGSYKFKGNISSVLIYNRNLTDTEVLNTFNATRSRFGV